MPSYFKPEQWLSEVTCQNTFHVIDLPPRYLCSVLDVTVKGEKPREDIIWELESSNLMYQVEVLLRL